MKDRKRQGMKTRDRILAAAVTIATQTGLESITRERVATLCDLHDSNVSYHFESMANLRSHVIRRAIDRKLLPIIAQGIAAGHPVAQSAPHELKKQALATLA